MSKTLAQIQNYVIRKSRIDISDTISTAAILEDANDAIGIIAAIKNWDELYKTKTLSLAKSDGDTVYGLDLTTDKIEQIRITSPITYYRPLIYVLRKELLAVLGGKTNNGTGTPSRWYYAEPSISSSNIETKEISFDIMPDMAYTISYTFRSFPPLLVNPGDYPFFDGNFHYIIGYYCMWQYAERNPDQTMNPDSWERKWNDGVKLLSTSYSTKVVINAPIPGPNINAGAA